MRHAAGREVRRNNHSLDDDCVLNKAEYITSNKSDQSVQSLEYPLCKHMNNPAEPKISVSMIMTIYKDSNIAVHDYNRKYKC